MNLPFFIPDYELNFRVGKLLCLFQILSHGSKKEVNLELQKLGQFEFLIKHPVVLNKILIDRDKKTIGLHKSEMYSIEALFLNRGEIFDLKKIKALLQILLSNGFINAKIIENQIFYSATTSGIAHAKTLESDYFQRIRDLYQQLKPLVNLPTSTIGKIIESHMTYGKKN
jgi:hypothetical protein